MQKTFQCLIVLWISGASVVNAIANTLELSSVAFDSRLMSTEIILTVTNVSEQSIVAWRGQLVCLDPFDDPVIDVFVIARSANIGPNESHNVVRRLDPEIGDEDARKVAQAALIVRENKAENFTCALHDLEIVFGGTNHGDQRKLGNSDYSLAACIRSAVRFI